MRAHVRTCQECGHQQVARNPGLSVNQNWRNLKCQRCKSIAMDYGSEMEVDDKGNVLPEPDIANEDND